MSSSKHQFKRDKDRNICPICREPRKRHNKTCGKRICMGIFAENKTKNRESRQKEAEPYIRKWAILAKKQFGTGEVCAVCGETLLASLDVHHFDRKKSSKDIVRLCGSCHRVFDSIGCGLKELEIRRKRYYNLNLDLWDANKR